MRNMEDEHLMTSEELQEFLRVSARFVRRLVSERRIEFIKTGREVKFPRRAVSEYLDRNRVRAMTRAQLRDSLWSER